MEHSLEQLKELVRQLIASGDIRALIAWQTEADFAKFCICYYKRIAIAKFSGGPMPEIVSAPFVDQKEATRDRIIFGSVSERRVTVPSRLRVLAEVPIEYPAELPDIASVLSKSSDPHIEFKPILRRNGVSIGLSMGELQIVIETLAAKHAEIRGGAWSGLGKRLELPLMLTLAKLYQVPASHYAGRGLTGESREVDFHFLSKSGDEFFCEVKLMGKGNPESADSTIARRSNIFIAQTLSSKNKSQLTNRGHHWIELGATDGYTRTFTVFNYLDIPCQPFTGDLDSALDKIIPEAFAEIA